MKIAATIVSVLLPILAFAGQDRGGGTDVGLEFATYARLAIQEIRNHPISGINEIELDRLAVIIDQIRVVTVASGLNVKAPVDQTTVDQPVVAINFPSALLIEVDDMKWRQLTDERVRGALALHEVASLIGVESTGDYHISSKFLMAAGYTRTLEEEIASASVGTSQSSSKNPPILLTDRVFVLNVAHACGIMLRRVEKSSDITISDVAYEGQDCSKSLTETLKSVGVDTFESELTYVFNDQSNTADCDFKAPSPECVDYKYLYDEKTGKLLAQKGDALVHTDQLKILDSSHLQWSSTNRLLRGTTVIAMRGGTQFYILSNFHERPITPVPTPKKPSPHVNKKPRVPAKTQRPVVRRSAARRVVTVYQTAPTVVYTQGYNDGRPCYNGRNGYSPNWCGFSRPNIGIQSGWR